MLIFLNIDGAFSDQLSGLLKLSGPLQSVLAGCFSAGSTGTNECVLAHLSALEDSFRLGL